MKNIYILKKIKKGKNIQIKKKIEKIKYVNIHIYEINKSDMKAGQ